MKRSIFKFRKAKIDKEKRELEMNAVAFRYYSNIRRNPDIAPNAITNYLQYGIITELEDYRTNRSYFNSIYLIQLFIIQLLTY